MVISLLTALTFPETKTKISDVKAPFLYASALLICVSSKRPATSLTTI